MRRCVLLLPGDPDTPTGGYGYDRRVVSGLRERGWKVELLSLPGAFPTPDDAARAQAEAAVAALPDASTVIADGLAFGALADVAERHASRLRWLALVHHPLGMEAGLGPRETAALLESERRALATARRIVVTSEATAQLLHRLEMAPSPALVIEPGCDLPVAPRPIGVPSWPVQLLCVASVTPRKGHLVLLDALAGLAALPWTLHCVGSLEMDPAAALAARQSVLANGLAKRVVWHGVIANGRLQDHYACADLFVLPSLFEGYGMVVSEALAHGLPIVASDTGAASKLLTGGVGVLVTPGDVTALRASLRTLITDPDRRAQLAFAALAARGRLPTWQTTCERWHVALQSLAAEAR